jgi:hypothetical protein
MGLVPDEGAVQEFVPASPDPAFGDRVHPGRLDVAEHGPDRRGAGSIPAFFKISRTVDAATFAPRLVSSPRILRSPHPGFSRASRRTRALMLRRVAGRPVLPRMDRADQRRRMMLRCQRRIVPGVTSSRSLWRRAFGYHAEQGRDQGPVRPVQVRAARLPPLLYGELVAQDQDLRGLPRVLTPGRRSHEVTRVIRRKTNRRHMSGDHHGWTAGRATLLVRAVDAILGTHSAGRRAAGPGAEARARRVG